VSGGGQRPATSLLAGIAIAALLSACSPSVDQAGPVPGQPGEGALVVYAVNYPLAYFAERIGGDAVDVRLPAPPGVDPAAWSPDAKTIAAYQRADLILLNGAGYAGWASRATLPASKLVDTSAGFADRYLVVDDAVTHTHGPEGEHAHGDIAFTTWLDPDLALLQAAAIRDALVRRRPDREAAFRSAYDALAADLNANDDGLQAVFTLLGGQPVLFSHPVYQYLARRYELDSRSLHWESDQALAVADVDDLNDVRALHPAGIMIWEAEPIPATRAALAGLGIASAVFDPCANRPADGDYAACMRRNLQNMESLL